MNNAVVNPVLDAKYASFVANGLTENSAYGLLVQDPAKPGGLEDWIATMHNSLLVALTNQGVSSILFAINSTVISNDTGHRHGHRAPCRQDHLVQRDRVSSDVE